MSANGQRERRSKVGTPSVTRITASTATDRRPAVPTHLTKNT